MAPSTYRPAPGESAGALGSDNAGLPLSDSIEISMMGQDGQRSGGEGVAHSRQRDAGRNQPEIKMVRDYTDDDGPMIEHMHDGYSDAVAHRAVPTPSAINGPIIDITRGMGLRPVNPQKAASVVERGANQPMIGEFAHPNIGNQREIPDARGDKTSDGQRVNGHRGNRSKDKHRDGHREAEEAKTSDDRRSNDHWGNCDLGNRLKNTQESHKDNKCDSTADMGKSSDRFSV